MNSLKHKLFFILVVTTGLIWLAATCWIYVGTTREVENVLDSRLQEAARMVLSLASSNDVGSFQKDSIAHADELLTYEHQLSCQIWSLDGRLVARTSGAPDESLSDNRTGFSERTIQGEKWRVFTAEDPAKNVRVLVGDRLGLRKTFVADIMRGLLAPLFLIIPLLAFLIWASLNRGLRPLQTLAEDLRRRNVDDLTPLKTRDIPVEIQPIVSSLNNLFKKVKEAMRHERDITAFAAHELRTPLAGLRTQAQIAMTAPDENIRKTALSQILFAVDRTTRLVRQLLTIARLDSESDAPLKSVNVGDVVEEVIDALPMSDKNADVTIDPVLRNTIVRANRESLLLAIRNLHENAVRHMPQPGTIRWSSETTEDATTVLVEDSGPGIPREELALVTNRFFRGRNRSSLGSGLGLSIADLAVRTSGARLRLRNRDDISGLRAEMVWDIRSPQRPANAAHTSRPYWVRVWLRMSGRSKISEAPCP
ncbi:MULTISPECIES: ATP-binding protein [Bradyrhizobium]|uniref:ATP-binding protein n=1 Tax=Bradyrhizobium elkanii TaxID=29448 RepID=UPI000426D2CB|nr:ATP-binding protein [Bradyrhizobium elkanii]